MRRQLCNLLQGITYGALARLRENNELILGWFELWGVFISSQRQAGIFVGYNGSGKGEINAIIKKKVRSFIEPKEAC